jgi:hypothetical protein
MCKGPQTQSARNYITSCVPAIGRRSDSCRFLLGSPRGASRSWRRRRRIPEHTIPGSCSRFALCSFSALYLASFGTFGTSLSAEAKGTFATFNPGGVYGTQVNGINESGTVTGDYGYTSEQAHGFVRTIDGTITTFDPPGSVSTIAMDINDAGTVSGFYSTSTNRTRSFVRNADGTITAFDAEDGGYTYARGISSKGAITGFVYDSNQEYSQAFIRSPGGKITMINPFGGNEAAAYGINASEEIAGTYVDESGGHGFVADTNGHIKSFDVPQAIDTGGVSINDSGTVVGNYYDVDFETHGFIRTADGQITPFDVPGCGGTWPLKINNKGEIAGTCGENRLGVSFIRKANGTFSIFHVPRSRDTGATDINDKGQTTGKFRDKNKINEGFLRTP